MTQSPVRVWLPAILLLSLSALGCVADADERIPASPTVEKLPDVPDPVDAGAPDSSELPPDCSKLPKYSNEVASSTENVPAWKEAEKFEKGCQLALEEAATQMMLCGEQQLMVVMKCNVLKNGVWVSTLNYDCKEVVASPDTFEQGLQDNVNGSNKLICYFILDESPPGN